MKKIIAGLMVGAALGSAERDASAQAKGELMPGYPNLSFQGVFPNPAKFCELGDWLFLMVSGTGGKQDVTLELSKNIDSSGNSAQLHAGVSSGGNWMINGSVPIDKNLKIGGTFVSGNRDGVLGVVHTFEHSPRSRIQGSAEYDFQAKAPKIAAEARFRLGPSTDVSISGNVKLTGKNLSAGMGLGVAPGGKARLWAGFGGKGWKDMTFAAQIPTNKRVLPEIGATFGKGKKPSFWLGVTVLLPRAKI